MVSLQCGRTGDVLISNIDGWDLMMDNHEYLYASDKKKYGVRRWKIGETSRIIVVDKEHSVYALEGNNHVLLK